MKKLALLALLFLAGCNTNLQPTLIGTQFKAVLPPASYYNCPVTPLPDKFTSNKDVASLLVVSHTNNLICKNSLNTIKNYLDSSDKILQSNSSK